VTTPKLVTLDAKNLTDIPARLRDLAASVETGKIPADCMLVVNRRPDGDVEIYGYGNVPDHDGEVGLLERAQIRLALMRQPVRR